MIIILYIYIYTSINVHLMMHFQHEFTGLLSRLQQQLYDNCSTARIISKQV